MRVETRVARLRRHLDRRGHTVRVIEKGAAGTVEKKYNGDEDGFVSVKAIVTDKTYEMAAGAVEQARGEADVQRSRYGERQMTVVAADLPFVPTELTRVVEDGVTYAVKDVNRTRHGETPLTYVMALRPVRK